MILTDLHSHTYPSSHDAKNTLQEMVQGAIDKGLAYYGVSNHFDYDIDHQKMLQLDANRLLNGDEREYFTCARQIQEQTKEKINFLVGAEFGFCQNPVVLQKYVDLYERFSPDYVINSIHGYDQVDYNKAKLPLDKNQVFSHYLSLVRQSLDAPYHYDVVGHIEYVVRYVKFNEKFIDVNQFGDQIDDILQTIIIKGKILEVNSSTYSLPRISLPSKEILSRYYELGGRKISFGSDAHWVDRIADKRLQIVEMLKDIGFTHLTVPFCGKYIQIEI